MFVSARSGPGTMLDAKSAMTSVSVELVDDVGVLLLGDRIKWDVLTWPKGQGKLDESWEEERR